MDRDDIALDSRSERLARRLVPLAIAAFGLEILVWSTGADLLRLLAIVPDDTAYYLQIARNAADGLGFTFDGLHATNGYQPFWQWLLVPVFLVVHADPATMLRLVLALQAVVLTAALTALYRVLGRRLPGRALLPGAIVAGVVVLVMGVDGMESALLAAGLALLTATALAGPAFRREAPAAQWSWGILLGLVMLARLDAVFLGASVCGFVVLQALADRPGRGAHLRRLVRIIGGASLVVAPYLAGNLLAFGSPVPISARLKSSFPHVAPDGLARVPRIDQVLVVVAIVWIVAVLVRRLRGPRPPIGALGELDLAVAVLGGYVVLHAVHAALFLKWAVFVWHFAGYWTFAALAFTAAAARLLPVLPAMLRRPGVYWTGIVLLAAVAAWRVDSRQDRTIDNWHTATWEAATWARQATSPDAVFAMKDAGNFGFFSERRTVNLDGVVNDAAFQRVLRDGRLGAYLRDNGVDYLVQHAVFDDPDVVAGRYGTYAMRYESHLFPAWSEPILLPQAAEVFRSAPYHARGTTTVLAVWRLDGVDDPGAAAGP